MTQELPEGTVTILFTDVVGSTHLSNTRGDAAAQEIMRAQREVVRDQLKEHGGYEVKGTGDGSMAAFQSARRAVACAIGIQRALAEQNNLRAVEQRVLVRIGMNAGEVIREDDDLFGTAVNAAARVASKAEGGQILVSETVKSLVGAAKDLEFADRGRFRLKGFTERWRLFEVVWQEEASMTAVSALAERTPFVGRESEREELRGLVRTANSGHGTIVLIAGEAGVGKSRLAEEVATEARQLGMLALTGRCYEMTGAPPYIPFVEMLEAANRLISPEAFRAALGESAPEVAKLVPELRRMLPDIQSTPELPPEQERRYVFNGVRDFIGRAGRAQPLLLIIEDLHWADDSSMVLLLHIAQHLSEIPVLILATYRDLEVSTGSPLSRTLEELTRQRLARHLSVKRLPESAVASMLRTVSGREPPKELVTTIFAETEGNPFFVEEVLKHLIEEGRLFDERGDWRAAINVSETDVPETLRLVIGRRLERLAESTRRVLISAAVIGHSFSFELLSSLSDLDADLLLDAVDEAERAQLLSSTSEGPRVTFKFGHELIRQTLLASVSAARRQRMHLRAAEVMEQAQAYARQEHAPDVAYHLTEAGATADPLKTVHYLTLAGDRALSSAAFEEALRSYQEALSLQSGIEQRTRAELLYKLGLAKRSLGNWGDALNDWRQAIAAYQSIGDAEAIGRIFGATTQQLLWAGRFEEALDLSLRGLRRLGRRPGPDRCVLLVGGGLSLSLAGFYEAGDKMMTQAVALAEELGDDHLLGRVLTYKAFHHLCYIQLAQQLEAATKAVALLRAAGDQWELSNALALRMFALYSRGQVEETDRVGEELKPLATRVGHYGALLFCGRMLDARQFMSDPVFEKRVEFVRTDAELCSKAGIPVNSHSQSYLGLVRFWQGRWDDAVKSCEEAYSVEAPGVFTGIDWATLFLVRSYAGQKETALKMLRDKKTLVPTDMTLAKRVSTILLLLRAARSSGLNAWTIWRIARQTGRATVLQRLPKPGGVGSIGASLAGVGLIEGLAVSGATKEAGEYYSIISSALISTGAVLGFSYGPLLHRIAGIAAAGASNWTKAEEHFRTALLQANEFPHKLEQPEVRRWYARMLLDRGSPGDREVARTLLHEAIVAYRDIGMTKHVGLTELMLSEGN